MTPTLSSRYSMLSLFYRTGIEIMHCFHIALAVQVSVTCTTWHPRHQAGTVYLHCSIGQELGACTAFTSRWDHVTKQVRYTYTVLSHRHWGRALLSHRGEIMSPSRYGILTLFYRTGIGSLHCFHIEMRSCHGAAIHYVHCCHSVIDMYSVGV